MFVVETVMKHKTSEKRQCLIYIRWENLMISCGVITHLHWQQSMILLKCL